MTASDTGQVNAAWVLIVVLIAVVVAVFQAANEQRRARLQLPTTEQVGESIGKQSVRFSKGLIRGVKEQVSK